MKLLVESSMCFLNLEAKFCEDVGELHGQKLCRFETMAKLEDACELIFGHLCIGFGDEKYLFKLKKVSHIFGRVIVKDTTLRKLKEALPKIEYIASLDDPFPVIELISNKNMTDAFLEELLHVITKGDIHVVMYDNHPNMITKIDHFEMYYRSTGPPISFYGGVFGCPSDKISQLGTEILKSCTTLINGLFLNSPNIPPELYMLSNFKYVQGKIDISHTNLRDLSFFKTIRVFKPQGYFDETRGYVEERGLKINIHHNPELKMLGWESLRALRYFETNTINLENLHPDFCITIQEMLVFLEYEAKFLNLHAKFCGFDPSEFQQKICKFSNMTSLESDCVYVFGNLLIENGDEEFVEKLKNVTYIFGSLAILNTDLDDLEFLLNLRKMANLNDSLPLIRIINNTDMRNVELPSMSGSISRRTPITLIENNRIFKTTQSCMIFQYNTRTNVSYNGGTVEVSKMV